MTRNEIIEKIYTNDAIKGIIRGLCYRHKKESQREDLLQHLVTKLCEQPPERIIQLHADQRLSFFCYGIIRNALVNPRDEFAKQHVQHEDLFEYDLTEAEEQPEPILLDDFKCYCLSSTQSPDSYTQLAAKVTYGYIIFKPGGKKSYRKYAKETGIHYSSICEYVKLMRINYLNEKHKVSTAQ